jgi:hypothetical protein
MSPQSHCGSGVYGAGIAGRFSRAVIASLVFAGAVCFATDSLAVTFTSNVTISEGNTTYDGQDIALHGDGDAHS